MALVRLGPTELGRVASKITEGGEGRPGGDHPGWREPRCARLVAGGNRDEGLLATARRNDSRYVEEMRPVLVVLGAAGRPTNRPAGRYSTGCRPGGGFRRIRLIPERARDRGIVTVGRETAVRSSLGGISLPDSRWR
ncbi:hypothetical protein Ga0074812_14432 [Parafrankia irregularis]|uniref:Uncharacterized protein n=1 Tax=Parafrankia irregularis TaxID=795642 RepID=A0A0S4QZR4_9ACTN|nr:hypothetical protein Ga0074812_14432 [Parafrankia irregularis]